jgi:hypothetical protein
LFIPGCSVRTAYDCALADFAAVAKRAIEPAAVDRAN